LARRDVLKIGALGLGGLTLADVLRLRGNAQEPVRREKSVIMIWLRGGPSHIDSFDMKPDAPAEIRGEFHPIPTNVPGIEICEYLPRVAKIMDKLAIIRGIRSNDLGDHTPHYISTGFPDRDKRPAMGAIVSYLKPRSDGVPPYVSVYTPERGEQPTYLGAAHGPFVPHKDDLANLRLAEGMTLGRLEDRQQLLRQLDTIRREIDQKATFPALDKFSAQAMEMITHPKTREAMDLDRESPETRQRYGRFWQSFLMARRLVEAGVNIVTLKIGDWDTHEYNFRDMRDQLPELDLGFHALVTDLNDRGLQNDVAVVMWGEFGRAPRVSRIAGRDHWPEAGAAVIAGGGFKVGQTIGETDSQAGMHIGRPYTPANVLASMYHHLGIDPSITIPDYNSRPMHVLDDREIVKEL
jgi:hypothetical protein